MDPDARNRNTQSQDQIIAELQGDRRQPTPSVTGPNPCPNCDGTGVVTLTEEKARDYIAGLWRSEALRSKSNAELATYVSEFENYLRHRNLSPLVLEFLGEVWWRLQAADEPAQETRRKIDALGDDPAWLKS